MRTLWQDLSYAFRTLRSNPGFAAVAIISLALGIGANSAIFSLADALMFRPMQVPRTQEVVSVFTNSKAEAMGSLSYPDYLDLRDNLRSVSGLAAYSMTPVGLSRSVDEVAQLGLGMVVSGNFFSLLEVQPALGRNFRAEEDSGRPGTQAVAILGDGAWERRFNRDPDVLGKTIRVNGQEFTIIGVAPKSFPGVDQYFSPEVYMPVRMYQAAMPGAKTDTLEDRGNRWLEVAGRMKSGLDPKAAQAESVGIMGRLAKTWPATNANRGAVVMQERDARFERNKGDGLLARTLLVIVGLVLLIACANIANLLLARASGRNREIAVRIAIGAGRWRLIRQLLTENLVIATLAGLLGLVLAYWGVQALALIKLPTDLPMSLSPRLDMRAIWYTALITLGTGVLFGLAPAWKTARTDLVTGLKGVDTTLGASRKLTLRNVLVVSQVALCVIALIVGGIMVRAFVSIETAEMGFRTEGVLLTSMNPAMARYTEERGREFYSQLMERARAVPGVSNVALTSHVPFSISGSMTTGVVVDGFELPADQENVGVLSAAISPGYFGAMKIRMAGGRSFDSRDTADSQAVVIVNEAMVKRFWKGRDPVGSRIRLENRKGKELVVVGVAGDSKYQWVLERPQAYMYRPYTQGYTPRMTLLAAAASAAADPASLADPVRGVVKSLDASIPVFDVRTFRTYFHDRALAPPRILSGMVAGLGGLAMVLAMVGLYGVIAYAVSRRTREIGIRMAIGADRSGVLTMIMRQGFGLGLIGAIVGVALSLLVTPQMTSELYGSGRKFDVLVYLLVPATLLAATVASCWAPARRAAKIDPWIALRYE